LHRGQRSATTNVQSDWSVGTVGSHNCEWIDEPSATVGMMAPDAVRSEMYGKRRAGHLMSEDAPGTDT
jgi:hypothetical protein